MKLIIVFCILAIFASFAMARGFGRVGPRPPPRPSGNGKGKGKGGKTGSGGLADLAAFGAVVVPTTKRSYIDEANFPPLVNGGTLHFSDGSG